MGEWTAVQEIQYLKRQCDEARQQAERWAYQAGLAQGALERLVAVSGSSSLSEYQDAVMHAKEVLAALAGDPPEAPGQAHHAQVLTADGWVDPNWPQPEAPESRSGERGEGE